MSRQKSIGSISGKEFESRKTSLLKEMDKKMAVLDKEYYSAA